jgi:acetylornithine deacetylase
LIFKMNRLDEVNRWVESNRDRILDTISELVQIRTENLPPGGNEKAGQEYLYEKFARFIPGCKLDLFEIDDVPGIRENPLFFPTIDGQQREYKERPILAASIPGSGGGRSLCFSGHIDTMPAYRDEWEIFKDPFSGKVKDGRMYGRGTVDMKAGTASGFFALKCLHDLGLKLRGSVFAESVVDEENGGVNGSIAARLRNPEIDFAVVPEPSDMIVGIESIGGSDWKVSVSESGPGGIGTDVELPNPIYKLSKIALALEGYDERLATLRVPDTYDSDMRVRLLTYQLHAGGSTYQESGSVPTAGHIFFWQEVFSYMSEAEARKDLLDFMQEKLGADPDFRDNFPRFETVIRFLEGHRTDRNHPALGSIRKAYEQLGLDYKEGGIPFATDAYCFRKVSKTDVAIIGPKGGNVHGVDEYVEIDSVLNLIKMMVLTAIDFCG